MIRFEDHTLIQQRRDDVSTMRRQACAQAGKELSHSLQLVVGQSARHRRRCPRREHGLAWYHILVVPGRVQTAGAQNQHLSSAGRHRHGLLLLPQLLSRRCRRQALGPSSLRHATVSFGADRRPKAVDPRQHSLMLGREHLRWNITTQGSQRTHSLPSSA